ncbi:MAG: 4Fe-4S binding protein [Candidatus Helarchaeota archaeon]|nr:4Fe-4S binding protein [Candidatus Helarchaeota archaeon]
MSEIDYYEEVRQKLRLGKLAVPKHEKVIEVFKILWNKEDIRLLFHFDRAGKLLTAVKLAKRAGLEKSKVKEILKRLAAKGTIIKVGNSYGLLPLVPGIFELYFLTCGDTEENMKKVAKLLRTVFDTILPPMFFILKNPLFRPKLPYEAKEKLIQINKGIETSKQVYPYELVEELINRNDYFVGLRCQCRQVGELAEEPCEKTPSELGCLACGLIAKQLTSMGIGKELTKEEAIDLIKRAEKAGLVHCGANSSGFETHILICNCCECHCGMLRPTAQHGVPGVQRSNFFPKINPDLCVCCETCAKKCPMTAIFHQWPFEADSSDERMIILEKCLGCGVCAVNCPKNAIKMERVRDENPPKQFALNINIFNP